MHAIFVIRLKGPRHSSHNPLDSLRVQPLNYVHNFNLTRQPKKKVTTPEKHVLSLSSQMSWHENGSGQSLERKGECWRGFQLCKSAKKKGGPVQRPVVQNTLDRRVKQRQMASSSLYLNELLIQKCKFRHRFTVNF